MALLERSNKQDNPLLVVGIEVSTMPQDERDRGNKYSRRRDHVNVICHPMHAVELMKFLDGGLARPTPDELMGLYVIITQVKWWLL